MFRAVDKDTAVDYAKSIKAYYLEIDLNSITSNNAEFAWRYILTNDNPASFKTENVILEIQQQ